MHRYGVFRKIQVLDVISTLSPFHLCLVNAAVCLQPCSSPARVASLLCKSALVEFVGCCLGADLVDGPGADHCGLHGAGPDAG